MNTCPMFFRRRLAIRWIWLVALFVPATAVSAQPSLTLSDQATISLITIYPGSAVHELFGHSAIRVKDPYNGFDLLYNYGTFQFDRSFLPKFIYGKLDYMLWVSDYGRELNRYEAQRHRSVVEQHLDLSHSQRQAIYDFLEYNALEENRSYRYDFLFDNCSTRIRDLFERVLGNAMRFSDEPDPQLTFRELLDSYLTTQPFLDTGIDIALGAPTDRTAAPREVMFLPIYLMEAFDHAVIDSAGTRTPLVAQTDTVSWTPSSPAPSKIPFWSTVWLVLLLGLWVTNGTSRNVVFVRKWFDRLLFGFCGIAGILALFLWFVAIHTVTDYNWNLIWAWPTHLLVLPALSSAPNWLKTYMRAAALVVFVGLLGWYFWPQEMNNALLPLLLTVAIRSAWWGWRSDYRSSSLNSK